MTPGKLPATAIPRRPTSPHGLAPVDPILPTLCQVLDPVEMLARISPLDPKPGAAQDFEITYVRYKPGLSCVIQYRIGNDKGDRFFHGRVCTEEGFNLLAAKAASTIRPLPDGRPGFHLFPDLRMVLTAFPHDRSVKGMRQLLEPDKLKRILHRVADRYDPSRRWVSGSKSRIEVVTYKPERRCLVRCDLGVRDRKTDRIDRETVFARIYGDNRGEAVFFLLKDLRNAETFGPEGAPVPLAVGFDPENRILFFDPVPGAPISTIRDRVDLLAAVERAGGFLARMHRSTVRVPGRLRAERYLEEARQTVDCLARTGLEETGALQDAIRNLERTRPEPPDGREVCLHGDFHPDQILARQEDIHCIDFDEIGMGEPGIDLGYFLAHLRKLILLGVLDSAGEEQAAGRFLDRYRAAGGLLPPVDQLRWHRGLTFLRQALNSIKHWEKNRGENVQFFLERIGK